MSRKRFKNENKEPNQKNMKLIIYLCTIKHILTGSVEHCRVIRKM